MSEKISILPIEDEINFKTAQRIARLANQSRNILAKMAIELPGIDCFDENLSRLIYGQDTELWLDKNETFENLVQKANSLMPSREVYDMASSIEINI